MAFFSYTCKSCGKPGMAEVADEDLEACGKFRPVVEGFARFLVHTRCGDFMQFKQRTYSMVANRLSFLERISKTNDEDDPALLLKREEQRLFLVRVTQRYCAFLCRYYKVIYQWEPYIVDQMMAKPKDAIRLLKSVEWGIKKLGNK